ncbi:hypothetical protein Landi51_02223 [Colletotrichum acutatum]
MSRPHLNLELLSGFRHRTHDTLFHPGGKSQESRFQGPQCSLHPRYWESGRWNSGRRNGILLQSLRMPPISDDTVAVQADVH